MRLIQKLNPIANKFDISVGIQDEYSLNKIIEKGVLCNINQTFKYYHCFLLLNTFIV